MSAGVHEWRHARIDTQTRSRIDTRLQRLFVREVENTLGCY